MAHGLGCPTTYGILVSLPLGGIFLTTGPPGKSPRTIFLINDLVLLIAFLCIS